MQTAVNSSTSSFKPGNRKRAFIKVICFLTIFILIWSFVECIFIDSHQKENSYVKRAFNEFYNTKTDINLLFIGSSHSYRSYDPEIFDKALSVNSFNLGGSAQKPSECYFTLKEALKYQTPKLVVYDVYWRMMEKEKYFDSKTYAYDNMKPSLNKLDFFFNDFDPDQYLKAALLSIRYHDKYKTIFKAEFNGLFHKSPTKVQTSKPKPSVQSYSEYYKKKGFVVNNGTISLEDLKYKNEFRYYKGPNWSDKQVDYLEKAIELCKEKKIPMLLVSAPIPPTSLGYVKNYNEIYTFISSIAIKYNVTYIDYNMINKAQKLVSDKYFKDGDHLNYDGVHIIDRDFVEKLKPLLF